MVNSAIHSSIVAANHKVEVSYIKNLINEIKARIYSGVYGTHHPPIWEGFQCVPNDKMGNLTWPVDDRVKTLQRPNPPGPGETGDIISARSLYSAVSTLTQALIIVGSFFTVERKHYTRWGTDGSADRWDNTGRTFSGQVVLYTHGSLWPVPDTQMTTKYTSNANVSAGRPSSGAIVSALNICKLVAGSIEAWNTFTRWTHESYKDICHDSCYQNCYDDCHSNHSNDCHTECKTSTCKSCNSTCQSSCHVQNCYRDGGSCFYQEGTCDTGGKPARPNPWGDSGSGGTFVEDNLNNHP